MAELARNRMFTAVVPSFRQFAGTAEGNDAVGCIAHEVVARMLAAISHVVRDT
jgi:hypothetical protein